jgi:hypothetical protein
MVQPNWVLTTLIGALAGYLFPYLGKALLFVARRFRREIVEGKWYAYHTTNLDGELQVVQSVWSIRKGFYSKFAVKVEKETLSDPMYIGILLLERNFWLVRLKGVKHEEEVVIRLFSPVPTGDAATWGLWLGIDFQGNPMAGPVMISREEVSIADALEFFSDKTKVHSKMRLLTA